jgi:hypothetical protein
MCISLKLLRKGQVLLFEELEAPKVSLGRYVGSVGFELRKSGSEARLTSTAEYQHYNLSVDVSSIWMYAKKSENHKSVPVVCRTHSLMGALEVRAGLPTRRRRSSPTSRITTCIIKTQQSSRPRRCTLRKKPSPGANDSRRGQARQFSRACGTLVDSPQRPYRFRDRRPRSDTFQQSLDQTASRAGTRMHIDCTEWWWCLPLCLSGSPCPEALAPSPTRLNASGRVKPNRTQARRIPELQNCRRGRAPSPRCA